MPVRQQLHRMGAGAPACAICGQAGHGLHYCPTLTTSEGCVMWAAWDKKWLLLLGQELMRYALCSDDAEYRRRSAALFSKCVVDRAEVLAFRRQHGIKSTAAGDKAFKDTRPATRMFRAARKPLRVSSAQNVSAEARKAANRRRNQRRRNKRKGKSIATQADDLLQRWRWIEKCLRQEEAGEHSIKSAWARARARRQRCCQLRRCCRRCRPVANLCRLLARSSLCHRRRRGWCRCSWCRRPRRCFLRHRGHFVRFRTGECNACARRRSEQRCQHW